MSYVNHPYSSLRTLRNKRVWRRSASSAYLVFCAVFSLTIHLGVTPRASAEETNFSRDVASSIDDGINWLDAQGIFTNPGNTSGRVNGGLGLAALALMERRVSADQHAAPTGYENATPADQVKIQSIMTYIINRSRNASLSSYRDGADLMAIALYLRTGGPSSQAGIESARAIFDRIRNGQGGNGYWGYSGSGNDSSTTQLIMAGLAGARGLFNDPQFFDGLRLNQLNEVTARTANGYATSGRDGNLPNDGKGHGYRSTGYAASYQQTASGLWAMIIGGFDINNQAVQDYMRWLYLRYNFQTIQAHRNNWNQSYFYFLWSSAKALTFLEDSGAVALPGNISTTDFGTLPSNQNPPVNYRLVLRNPDTDPRVARRGAGGAGYYSSIHELPRWYYDYAYTLMATQNAAGQFVSPHGQWDTVSAQSYALLVLERSVGGGCIDSDGDDICDTEDNCPTLPNPDQVDTDDDGVGDLCDGCPNAPNPNQIDSDGDGTGDACDVCPDLPNPDQSDADSDGVGDLCDNCLTVENPDQSDVDSDQFGDACDVCPDLPNPDQIDRDGDGYGDICDLCPINADNQTDLDGDGVGDACDNCLLVENPDQEDLDGDLQGDACDTCIGTSGPELCDGIDNDCDNNIDENPILSPRCEVPGGGSCGIGIPVCEGGEIICEPLTTAQDELCNGLDDDCDGQVDEDTTDVGRSCFTTEPGACSAGVSRCEDGELICDGTTGPSTEVCDLVDSDCDGVIDEGTRNSCGFCGEPEVEECDGVDQDCDGSVDEEATCENGNSCQNGECVEPCISNECFGEATCVDGFCIPLCADVECPTGQECKRGECFDPCADVTCAEGERCYLGECRVDSCPETPCPEGSRCGLSGCEPDPCFGVMCASDQFCREGSCVDSCGVISCGGNERCEDGRCLPDFCAEVVCAAGEECVEGTCVADNCEGVLCERGSTCVQGECVENTCDYIECPSGEACVLDARGVAQCVGAWTDPPEPETPIEETSSGEEMTNSAGEMMSPIDDFAGELSNTDQDSMGGSGVGQAESVSGCEQRSSHLPLAWLLTMMIALRLRRHAQRG